MEKENLAGFLGKVRVQGDSLVITLDKNVVTYEGIKAGDLVKVLIKVMKREEEFNNDVDNGNVYAREYGKESH